MQYYNKIDGEIILTNEGQHVLDYFGLSLNDLKRMSSNELTDYTRRFNDVLNDGKITKSSKSYRTNMVDMRGGQYANAPTKRIDLAEPRLSSYGDSGSFSRYFSLDAWSEKTLPFLIVPKASKSEKGEFNTHNTVKPIKLMSYLITMGSRPNDTILDPFMGSGTTGIAALQLGRKFIGIEKEKEYVEIANKRLKPYMAQTKLAI